MISPSLNQPNALTWPSSNNLYNSSPLHQFNPTDFPSTMPKSGLKMEPNRSHILVVPLLVAYLLSYILQLGFLGRGVSVCYQCNAAWFFKKDQRGLILPNTRFLISLCNILFVITQFTDTIFLVMSALGPALYAERYRISGFVWFTLWLSGWMLLWGIAACSIVIAYKKGGFIARVSSNSAMSKLFNTFFISGAIFVTITHIVTFSLTVANQLALSSEIQISLSQLSGSATSVTDTTSIVQRINSAIKLASIRERFREVVRLIFYMRLAWSLFLLALLVPLGISLIRMLQKVKSTKDSERSGSCFQVIDFESHTRKDSKSSEKTISLEDSSDGLSLCSNSSNKPVHLGSQKTGTITNVALVFLHILIYVLIVVGFAPSLHSSQQTLQDKAEQLTQLAYISKGLYAVVGLWSSLVFLRLTREIQSGKTIQKSIQGFTHTPRGSSPDDRFNKPSIPIKQRSSPTEIFNQLSLFQFPDKPAITPP